MGINKTVHVSCGAWTDKSGLRLAVADTFMTRFLGLMGRSRKSLPENTGLYIQPCSSIHMLFMRFPIDAVWVDRDMRVLKISRNVPPWTGFAWCFGADAVVELHAGTADKIGIKIGQCCVFH